MGTTVLVATKLQTTNEIRLKQALHHYEDHTAFFYGKISAAAASLITFLLSNELSLLLISLSMMVIMAFDVGNIKLHKRLIQKNSNKFTFWKAQYTFLSTSFMFSMGLWCFFCFTITADPFIHLLCISVTMGNILSLISRNFTSDKILTMQLSAVAIPIVLGLPAYGDFRSIILCAFFLPLFASVRDISARLRNIFSSMEKQSDEKDAFGGQLNEALESMSHGLMMFDDEMRLKIINKTARKILAIGDDINCYSKKLQELSRLIDAQRPLVNRVRILQETLTKRLNHKTAAKVFKVSQSQFVELSIKLREEGGCVLVIEDVTQRIEYQNRINQLAKFDELTGLCNRTHFIQQTKYLLKELEPNETASVLFFDLDEFKRINDTLGHEAGDHILMKVAERAKHLLPSKAICARYGGDEFVLYINDKDIVGSLDQLADSIVKDISRDVMFNNQRVSFGASLGIAKYPKDGTSIDRLLKLADLALYAAKESGKNTYRSFTTELEDSLEKRVLLEEDLTLAVANNDLELHFQPIVQIENGQPKIFEALTRWTRNGTDPISPAEFIPIAEDLGLISEIGNWTLREACKICKTWPADISVAVNLSAVQFRVGSIVDMVNGALKDSGLEPSRLEIEITETAILNDMEHAVLVLEELSAIGVRISLDDFGTGYSSLSYLHKLPLDKLKIDKSFIDDLIENQRSRTLLKGITVLGKALELKIVVEGVETSEQFDLLKKHYDVDFVQGFYFSKALTKENAADFIFASNESMSVVDEIEDYSSQHVA
jgi:diguanylate cyclase (GGDEF)-like protein